MTITIVNHGPLITETDYWGSELELAGKIYCSCNAGAIRVLLPRSRGEIVGECRTSKYVICSRGAWPAAGKADAVELLFEDNSDSPYVLHLSAESWDMLPAQPASGQEWVLSLWVSKEGQPHKALERPCRWRRSAKLPDLSPWE